MGAKETATPPKKQPRVTFCVLRKYFPRLLKIVVRDCQEPYVYFKKVLEKVFKRVLKNFREI